MKVFNKILNIPIHRLYTKLEEHVETRSYSIPIPVIMSQEKVLVWPFRLTWEAAAANYRKNENIVTRIDEESSPLPPPKSISQRHRKTLRVLAKVCICVALFGAVTILIIVMPLVGICIKFEEPDRVQERCAAEVPSEKALCNCCKFIGFAQQPYPGN